MSIRKKNDSDSEDDESSSEENGSDSDSEFARLLRQQTQGIVKKIEKKDIIN